MAERLREAFVKSSTSEGAIVTESVGELRITHHYTLYKHIKLVYNTQICLCSQEAKVTEPPLKHTHKMTVLPYSRKAKRKLTANIKKLLVQN